MCRIAVYVLEEPITKRIIMSKHAFYLPGDVFQIVEDGESLGADVERGHPSDFPPEPKWFHIIEMPGVAADDPRVAQLMEYADPWKRRRYIDLNHQAMKTQRGAARSGALSPDDLPIVERGRL